MVYYLKAIGFSKTEALEDINKLINTVVHNPDNKHASNFSKEKVKVEYYKKVGERMGLIVRGELGEKEELVIHTIMPYVDSNSVLEIIEADVEKVEGRDSYYVYCEDEETGTQVDFALQNVIDYLEVEDDKDVAVSGATLVGLSTEGKIILNVDKDEAEEAMEKEEEAYRKELLTKARDGDEEARELLDIEAEEMEEIIEERLQEEDLFTILEGYLMPFGESEGIYSVLGTIKKVETWENIITKEKVYHLNISCIGINFEVCIHTEDLLGEPSIGMRFLGSCWMQGKLIFD